MKKFQIVGFVTSLTVCAMVARLFAAYGNPIQDATQGESTAEFISVYNADDVTHEVGDVVVFAANSTYDLAITTTTTANNGLVAGVIAGQDCAAATFCRVQVAGYHGGVTIGVANSAGDSLVTSTTGEAAGVYSVVQATGIAGSNQATTFGVFGVALEATTSSTTVKAWLMR